MNTRFFRLRCAGAAALLLCLLLCCVLPAGAAEGGTPGVSGKYTSVLYNSANGLPTSDANDILQSPEGFVWIGNYSGLIRYDGNQFYRYPASTGISSVITLFCDSRERLWIGTNDKGVGVLEDDQFRFYDREEGLPASSVRSITEDPAGNILIATTSGVAYVDPAGRLSPLDDPQLNREYVCELSEGPDGLVFGVTLDGSFFTIRDLRLESFYPDTSLGANAANTVWPDQERPDRLYIGTSKSAVLYASLDGGFSVLRQIDVSPLVNVNSIRTFNGIHWICADNGAGFLDEDLNFTQLRDIPLNNSIDHVMEDFEGNLWFTSSRQGVLKIVPNRFRDLSREAGLPNLVVNATCRSGGLLYIGSDTGLTILDGNNAAVENELTEYLDGVRIRCILEDSGGTLWFCTRGGLVRRGPGGEITSYTTDDGLPSNQVRMMIELSGGGFAVATNGGACVLRDGAVAETYAAAQGISNPEILTIAEAPDGRLYLGSDGDGIYAVSPDKTTRLGRMDGLESEVILRVKRDAADPDLYWIVTSSSLAWMRDDRVTTLHSFPYTNNYDIFFDALDRAWVVGSGGIYVVKRDELLRDAVKNFTLYDIDTGLPRSATANSYSDLTPDGVLYIASTSGVSAVNISADPEDTRDVRLAVPFVEIDDRAVFVPEDGKIEIPSDCRRLNIYPYAFTYTLNNPHVAYQLEGFDQEPQTVTRRELGAVTYTNLPGGTYRFRLAVLDSMTGEETASLSIGIAKELTLREQRWFMVARIVFAAVAAGLVVFLYFRHKTRVLLRKQEQDRKYIHEMSSVFANCIDMKDPYTNGHSHRVAKYSALLAERLGKSREEVDEIYNIALLHDIGKISIPDKILNKPDKLTDEEYEVMKNHSQRGYEILQDVTIDPQLSLGAGYHHERIDGKGYPRGLKGDEIPEIARIIAVADTFDAMYSTRPYRKRLSLDVVAEEIRKAAGTQLSPPVVDAFMELVDEGAFDNE